MRSCPSCLLDTYGAIASWGGGSHLSSSGPTKEKVKSRMRRRALLLVAIMTAALVASGIAIAEVKNGTSGNDNLRGTNAADTIDGRAGNDTTRALGGNDKVTGGRDNDALQEAAGNDTYFFD